MKIRLLLLPFISLPLFCGCAKNITVNETEWKEAVEKITHINKRNELNYVCSGNIKGQNTYSYGLGHSFEFTKLECNNKIEKADLNIDYEGQGNLTKETKYSENLSNNINLVYTTKYNFSVSNHSNSYILNAIFDIYNYFQDFSFNKSNNRYECKNEFHGKAYFIGVKFYNNKTINELECDYSVLNETGNYTTVKGKLTFTYGNSVLNKNEFPKRNTETWDEIASNSVAKFNDTGNKSSYINNSGAIIIDKINNDNALTLKSTLTDINRFIFRCRSGNYTDIVVYQDGVQLNRGDKKLGDGDYYLDDVDSLIDFSKIVFRNSIKDKYIEIVFKSMHGATFTKYEICLGNGD